MSNLTAKEFEVAHVKIVVIKQNKLKFLHKTFFSTLKILLKVSKNKII